METTRMFGCKGSLGLGGKRAWLSALVLACAIGGPLPASGAVALREPGTMSRDEVRSGIRDRQRGMDLRQQRQRERRFEDGRRRIGPGGRSTIRLPRNPIPAPPPESLP